MTVAGWFFFIGLLVAAIVCGLVGWYWLAWVVLFFMATLLTLITVVEWLDN